MPDNATVTVYYKMNGMEAEETIELKKFTYDNGGTPTTIDTWEKGIRYVYRIAFGKNESERLHSLQIVRSANYYFCALYLDFHLRG